jgi:hypothetical protein
MIMADPTCSTHGWSILNSAQSHSAFAGVLAGFAFTAAVIYMGGAGQAPDESTQDGRTIARNATARSLQEVQAIALFTASFIVLGLDSYLFSVVAGNRPFPGIAQPSEPCGRVWSQALIANGMLAVGAVAMVCNITTLFLSQQLNIKDENSRHYLRFFLISLTGAGMLAIILFLGLTSVDYLDVVYDDRVPSWFAAAVWVITFGNIGLAIYFGSRSYLRKTASTHAPHANGQNIKPANRLKMPTYLIVVYAGIGPIAAAAARYPNWPEKPITWVVVAYWILGLIFPAAIVVWLADAVLPGKTHYTQPVVSTARLVQAKLPRLDNDSSENRSV